MPNIRVKLYSIILVVEMIKTTFRNLLKNILSLQIMTPYVKNKQPEMDNTLPMLKSEIRNGINNDSVNISTNFISGFFSKALLAIQYAIPIIAVIKTNSSLPITTGKAIPPNEIAVYMSRYCQYLFW